MAGAHCALPGSALHFILNQFTFAFDRDRGQKAFSSNIKISPKQRLAQKQHEPFTVSVHIHLGLRTDQLHTHKNRDMHHVHVQCLRFKLLLPIFSAWMRMPLDVPNVETRTSNLLSKLMAWAISRAPSMVDSLNLHGQGVKCGGTERNERERKKKWSKMRDNSVKYMAGCMTVLLRPVFKLFQQ